MNRSSEPLQPRVLSLTQPWASFCIWIRTWDNGQPIAEKEYETRSFGCSWARNIKPQPLYIHAAQNFPRWAKDLCEYNSFFRKCLERHGWTVEDLPTGVIIGRVNVKGSIKTEAIREQLSHQERAFGDYESGRLAIRFTDPFPFDGQFRAKGSLGLWNIPTDLHERISTLWNPK